MPHFQIYLRYCLITQGKQCLKYVPQNYPTYYINSKRRFFLYFKHLQHLEQVEQVLISENIQFYRRPSHVPDRQQYEEHVFHCNYRYKKKDLRKMLNIQTPYDDPKTYFNQPFEQFPSVAHHNKVMNAHKQNHDRYNNKKEQQNIEEDIDDEQQQQEQQQQQFQQQIQQQDKKQLKFSKEVQNILNNYTLLKKIFKLAVK